MSWAHPQALWLLVFLPLAFAPLWRGRSGARLSGACRALKVSGLAPWAPRVLAALRVVSAALLILALARPQRADARVHTHHDSISIQLVIDTSLSMGYTDYTLGGHDISRMDAARHAVRLFVQGDEAQGLPGRKSDFIGLISFNRHPEVACPLTRSHDQLLAALEQLPLGPHTNIGDGLAWGLDRLRGAPTQERIVILLSDGKQNVPEALDPVAGARLAADLGVRVYTIGAVGNRVGGRPRITDLFRRDTRGQLQPPPGAESVDEDTLRRIAETTGGKYFRATETDKLLEVYRDIDALTKTRVQTTEITTHQDCFPWFLLPGLLGLCLEQALATTRFLVL